MRHVWIVLVLFACKSSAREEVRREARTEAKTEAKTDVATEGSGDLGVVQPRFSEGRAAPTDAGTLGFTITKVHANRKPATAAPFHEAGGDWTYVEAHVDDDPTATFIVGMPAYAPAQGRPGFGKMMFAPTTKHAGDKVIALLAKRLGVSVPPTIAGGVLQAMKVPIALLGVGIGKLDNGLGGKGTWTATKLFCSAGDIDSAELFFNISVASKRGKFSEKDTDYNKDVVACLAIALRDGALPPRTPANDSTLSATGPRLELGKKIGERRMEGLALTPARLLMIDERGDSAAVVEVDVKTGKTRDLYKTAERIESGSCDDTGDRCVLKVSTPSEARNVFGGGDKTHLVSLERTISNDLALPALGERPDLAGKSISPDGRFVVVRVRGDDGAKLLAINRETKQSVALPEKDKEYLAVVAWVKEVGKWVAVVTRTIYEDQPSVVVDWHVEAKGEVRPSKRPGTDETLAMSPDGKRHAEFTTDGKLVVTAGGKPRTLAFHPADAKVVSPDCCKWIDNRFIQTRTGFIDTDAMKVSLLPVDPEEDAPRITYVRGTRTAIVVRGDGAYLANLVGP